MSTEPINYADKLGTTGPTSRQCANIAPGANASVEADANYPLSGNYSSQPKTESGFANFGNVSYNSRFSQHAQSLPPPSRPSISFGSSNYAGNVSTYSNYSSNNNNNRNSDLSEAQTPSNQSISSFPSSSGATNYSDANSSFDTSPLASSSKYFSSKTTDFSNINTNNNITSHSSVIPPPPMLPPVSSTTFGDITSLPRFGSSINISNHHTLPLPASNSADSDVGLAASTTQINNQTMFPPLPSMSAHTQYQNSIGSKSINGNPANYCNTNANNSLRDPEFTESDIKTLKNLLSTGEKVKWKYISNQLQLQKDGKRASPSSCAKKASELFNLPKDEMQGSLGTSLPYVVHPNGWSSINKGLSQQHGGNNVRFQTCYSATQ